MFGNWVFLPSNKAEPHKCQGFSLTVFRGSLGLDFHDYGSHDLKIGIPLAAQT